ncbi:alpha/beta fold hydrolase, partial [uncultured Microbulbifer sp.]|uniref:alpha/beta hydrolase n=1 Tax=uncultured Microbulbifer sp. TaxID=348147 RepID=UPI0025F21BD6
MKARFRLAALCVPLLLARCGAPPGPGPASGAVEARTRGHEVGRFETHDGRQLAYVVHRASRRNPRRAGFLYLHGIESHSEWFDEAARQLAQRGYPVVSIDRRGSGINRENRGYVSGHVERGTHLVDDIHRAVRIVRERNKADEIYLIGLSWGGKYVMAYDASYPGEVDGMVLITPGMKPKVDLTPGEKLAVFTDSVFAPKLQHR